MSYISIVKNDYYRTMEFVEFEKTRAHTVFMFLFAHVVRDTDYFTSRWMYDVKKRYYDNGMLVARYREPLIADMLGLTIGTISESIRVLKGLGFIKVIEEPKNMGGYNTYHFGFWKKDEEKDRIVEATFFNIYFDKFSGYRKTERDAAKFKELEDSMDRTEADMFFKLQEVAVKIETEKNIFSKSGDNSTKFRNLLPQNFGTLKNNNL